MDLSDEALIDSFRKTKDPVHFKALVRRYQTRIYNAAFRVMGNQEEAEEVVQETYIKVHQNLVQFHREASFGSWIFRIAHNICMDMLRVKQRRSTLKVVAFDPQSTQEGSESLSASPGVVTQIPDDGLCPAELVDLTEQSEMIQASLRDLPDSQRVVVVLHDIEGFSYQEIAEIVGANLGTVRSRLHYGRLRLRQLLEPYFSPANVSPSTR